jgi:DNA repair photolyase
MAPTAPLRGRGTPDNPSSRFERLKLVVDDDVHDPGGAPAQRVPTEIFRDESRSIISRNESPDVGFETSVNPYRGCEHGCIYCYARPYHEYLGLSAGLDFETKLFVKERAPELLRAELSTRSWRPQTVVLSGVTDPYQPIERSLRLTRRCLEVLADFRNPVAVITKSAGVTRDLDVLRALAAHDAASVALSVTTLDEPLRGAMEPRAATGEERIAAVARLNEAGVPAGVMIGPVIPGLNDHEVPRILARAADAGAQFAGYVMLKLSHGLAPMFDAWLERHFPDRRTRVLERIRDVRGGRLNDPRFGARQRGTGPYAELVADVFRVARERAGIPERGALSTAAFRVPGTLGLFDESLWK